MNSPLKLEMRRERFVFAWAFAFAISIIYTLGLLLSVPFSDFAEIWLREASWGIYGHLILPTGVALLICCIDFNAIRAVRPTVRWLWIGVFATFSVGIVFAVRDDAMGVPTPDRILNPARDVALRADACLRRPLKDNCKTEFNSLQPSNVERFAQECLKNPRWRLVPEVAVRRESTDQFQSAKARAGQIKYIAYYCALLEQLFPSPAHPTEADVRGKFQRSPIAHAAALLNFALIEFIALFLFYSLFLFVHMPRFSGKVIYPLIASLAIIMTWFPFRALAEWNLWYRDLSHLRGYEAFWILFVTSIVLTLLYIIWVVRLEAGRNARNVITWLYAGIIAVPTAVLAIKQSYFETAFTALADFRPVFLLIGAVIVAALMLVFAVSVLEDETEVARQPDFES